jgi:hypothetical protein
MEAPSLPNVSSDLKKLTKLLALSTAQQEDVKAILTDQRAQLQAAIKKAEKAQPADQSGPPGGSLWESFRSIRQDTNSRIEALLSSDQAEKFTAWQKKQQKDEMHMGPGGPPPDGGGPPPGGGGPPPGGGGPPGL